MSLADIVEHDRFYSAVGRLVDAVNWLEYGIDNMMIAVFRLPEEGYAGSIVATLEISRKIEMLRSLCEVRGEKGTHRDIMKFLDRVEKVNRVRNEVAHSMTMFREGKVRLYKTSVIRLNRGMRPKNPWPDLELVDIQKATADALMLTETADNLAKNMGSFYKVADALLIASRLAE